MGNLGMRRSGSRQEDSDIDLSELYENMPDEILTHILSFLPASHIINNCQFVSKRFKTLCDHPSLWSMKLQRDQGISAHTVQHELLDIRKIYVFGTFSRNLLQKDINIQKIPNYPGWIVQNHYHMCIESRADRTRKFPGSKVLDEDSLRCLAFSYEHASLEQEINLLNDGLSQEFMDSVKPPITVSFWTAARNDCGSSLDVYVKLLDHQKVIGAASKLIRRHYGTGIDQGDEELNSCQWHYSRRVQQWEGGEWIKVSCTFTDYPEGIRYVWLKFVGKDTKFWAGFYGPKIASMCVRVNMPGADALHCISPCAVPTTILQVSQEG